MQNSSLAMYMRLGMRRVASSVCVLSVTLPTNEHFAMTVSSVTSVSDSPASLLVCINQQVSQQSYLSTLGSRFAINVLGCEHQGVSNLCAGRDQNCDRFSIGKWTTAHNLPVLADAQAVFVCETDQVTTYGTHHIVIGRILEVILNEATVNPLIYLNGSYGAFSTVLE